MKYFAVIDTNVIVSAMLKSDSMPAQVLKEVLVGNINMLVNEQILDEYLEVLSRKKFRFPIDDVINLVNEIKKRQFMLIKDPRISISRIRTMLCFTKSLWKREKM